MSAPDVVMVVVGLLVSAFYLISCLVNHENPFFYYEEEEEHDQDQSVI